MNQRSAQAILGHTDANLTANVYTDVPALALHDEIAKYPWIDNQERGTQTGAHDLGTSGHLLVDATGLEPVAEILETLARSMVRKSGD